MFQLAKCFNTLQLYTTDIFIPVEPNRLTIASGCSNYVCEGVSVWQDSGSLSVKNSVLSIALKKTVLGFMLYKSLSLKKFS